MYSPSPPPSDCNTNCPESDLSATSNPSAGFETDSTVSGEVTDYDEDEESTRLTAADIPGSLCDDVHVELTRKGTKFEGSLLTPLKRALVEQLMHDFWGIFNRERSENIRRCTG